MRTDAVQEAELFAFGSFETGKSAASYAFVPGGGQRPGGQDEHGKKSRGGGRDQIAASDDDDALCCDADDSAAGIYDILGIEKRKTGGKKMTKKTFRNFLREEDGMGTVEVILIIVVLIGLVIIFKTQLTQIVNNIFEKISSQSSSI